MVDRRATDRLQIVQLSGGEIDREDLRTFLARAYGDESYHADRAHILWRYRDNPSAEGRPTYWLCIEDGRILGVLGAIPVRLAVDGASREAAYLVEFIVLPDERGRGIGSSLVRAAGEAHQTLIAIGITPDSRRVFERFGYGYLGMLPYLVRPMRRRPSLRRLLRIAPAHNLSASMRWKRRPRVRQGVAFDEVEAFGDDVDVICEAIARGHRVVARRDRAFLNWKYVSQPRMAYEIRKLTAAGDVLGYAVLRCVEHDGARVGLLVDFLASRGHAPALVEAALARFVELDVTEVQTFLLSRTCAKAFARLGFYEDHPWKHVMVSTREPDRFARWINRRRAWCLTRGDSDLDRPEV